MGIGFVPSNANFMLIDVGGPERSKAIVSALRNSRILIGGGFNAPLERYIRVSIGPVQVMERFLDAFRGEWTAMPVDQVSYQESLSE
jgi:histidinol-phosphate/aromatic aminotransferase/cobyric acid decarboxylase-like protein